MYCNNGQSAVKLLNQMARRTFNDHSRVGLIIQQQKYGANQGVGENPLNGNGVALTDNAEG